MHWTNWTNSITTDKEDSSKGMKNWAFKNHFLWGCIQLKVEFNNYSDLTEGDEIQWMIHYLL